MSNKFCKFRMEHYRYMIKRGISRLIIAVSSKGVYALGFCVLLNFNNILSIQESVPKNADHESLNRCLSCPVHQEDTFATVFAPWVALFILASTVHSSVL